MIRAGPLPRLEDIQGVTRRALNEVRGAVQGYRTLGLSEAVDGAKAALAAAGIDYRLDGGQVAVRRRWSRSWPGPFARAPPTSCGTATRALRHPYPEQRQQRSRRGRGRQRRRPARRKRSGRTCRARERCPRNSGGRRKAEWRLSPPTHRSASSVMIRVLIAEDQAMVRERWPAFSPWKTTSRSSRVERGDRVLPVARSTRPDIALLDVEMPGRDGIEVAAELTRELPATRSLILTTFGRPGYLRRALEHGASGFLLKDAPAMSSAAIREVAAGGRVLDQPLAAAAVTEGTSPLTARELEVFAAATRHDTASDIAAALHLGGNRAQLPQRSDPEARTTGARRSRSPPRRAGCRRSGARRRGAARARGPPARPLVPHSAAR